MTEKTDVQFIKNFLYFYQIEVPMILPVLAQEKNIDIFPSRAVFI
jgi:hypothetical protein